MCFKKYIVGIIFIFLVRVGYGQASYDVSGTKEGFIITSWRDTLHGFITPMPTEMIYTKSRYSEIEKYKYDHITCYKFGNNRYDYIYGKGFYQLLVDGIVKLYVQKTASQVINNMPMPSITRYVLKRSNEVEGTFLYVSGSWKMGKKYMTRTAVEYFKDNSYIVSDLKSGVYKDESSFIQLVREYNASQ